MTYFDYTYSVLNYRHDVTSGESLNVGVVLACEEEGWADVRWEDETGRLTRTFRDFNSRLHREIGVGLKRFFRTMKDEAYKGQRPLFRTPDAAALVKLVWADTGLVYRATASRPGRTSDLADTLDELFETFIRSQSPIRPSSRLRRSREDVWRRAFPRLDVEVRARLRREVSEAQGFRFEFDHAYRNGLLHIVEPATFDLEEPARLRDRALQWRGTRELLRDAVGSLSLIVAPPTSGESEITRAFDSATALLIDANIRVYQEEAVESLDGDLREIMALTLAQTSA